MVAPAAKKHTVLIRMLPAFIKRRIEHRPGLVKILDNIGWLFFDKILRMGVGLLVGVWIARYLGPEQFGLLNYALAFTGLFGTIATLGLQSIVVRDILRDPNSARLTLGTAALLQFIGGLITYVLILIAIAYLRPDDPLARSIVAILGAVLFFKASDIAVYWFESQLQSKYTVWVQNSVFVLFSLIKILFLMQKAPLTWFVWATLAEAILAGIILFAVMGKYGHQLTKLLTSFNRAKTLLQDSWPMILSAIAIMVYMKIDQIMIGEMIDNEAVGVYSAGIRVSEIWYFIPLAITMSIRPYILKAKWTSNDLRYVDLLKALSAILFFTSIVIGFIFFFLSDYIIRILFGVEYKEAARVLMIHVWTGMFVGFGLARGVWVLSENMQRYDLFFIISGALINVALNFMLIPAYGITGAAYATLIAQAFVGLISPVLIRETRKSFFILAASANLFSWPNLFIRIKAMSTRQI